MDFSFVDKNGEINKPSEVNKFKSDRQMMVYNTPNNFLQDFSSFGFNKTIIISLPKFIDIPFFNIILGSVSTNHLSEVKYASNINYDIQKGQINSPESVFAKIAEDYLKYFPNVYIRNYQDGKNKVEIYHLTYRLDKYPLFDRFVEDFARATFYTKKTEYVFIIDNRWILPVYVNIDDSNWPKIQNKWVSDFVSEDILQDAEYNFWDWISRYSPNVEAVNKNGVDRQYDYSIDVCDVHGELTTLWFTRKPREIGRFKLISCRSLS